MSSFYFKYEILINCFDICIFSLKQFWLFQCISNNLVTFSSCNVRYAMWDIKQNMFLRKDISVSLPLLDTLLQLHKFWLFQSWDLRHNFATDFQYFIKQREVPYSTRRNMKPSIISIFSCNWIQFTHSWKPTKTNSFFLLNYKI